MPNYTDHYKLIKPKPSESYNIEEVTCTNADVIDEELFKKQQKESGKGLSTNDFTNGYKQKIDRIYELSRGYSAYEIALQNRI